MATNPHYREVGTIRNRRGQHDGAGGRFCFPYRADFGNGTVIAPTCGAAHRACARLGVRTYRDQYNTTHVRLGGEYYMV